MVGGAGVEPADAFPWPSPTDGASALKAHRQGNYLNQKHVSRGDVVLNLVDELIKRTAYYVTVSARSGDKLLP